MFKINFRFEANQELGAGHAIRCLSLAQRLKKRGCHISILSSQETYDFLGDDLLSGYAFIRLPDDNADFLVSCDLMVIDHYDLDASYHQKCRQFARKIMVIDDLADRTYDADLLLDQTYGRQEAAYVGLLKGECRYMLGSEFALLRDEFALLRAASLERKSKVSVPKGTLLISFGYADPTCSILLVLRALHGLADLPEIKILLGARPGHMDAIEDEIKKFDTKPELLIGCPTIAEEMMQADLMIGASGSQSWERCCLGMPAIIMETGKDQHLVATALEKKGAVLNLGWFEDVSEEQVRHAFLRFACEQNLYKVMAEKAAEICDGKGLERIVSEVFESLR